MKDTARFRIVFPDDDAQLDFFASEFAMQSFAGTYPLFEMIKSHIRNHGREVDGAVVYEVIEHEGELTFNQLTTLSE